MTQIPTAADLQLHNKPVKKLSVVEYCPADMLQRKRAILATVTSKM